MESVQEYPEESLSPKEFLRHRVVQAESDVELQATPQEGVVEVGVARLVVVLAAPQEVQSVDSMELL